MSEKPYKVEISNDLTVGLSRDYKTIEFTGSEYGCGFILTMHEAKLLRAALLAAMRHAGYEQPQEPSED